MSDILMIGGAIGEAKDEFDPLQITKPATKVSDIIESTVLVAEMRLYEHSEDIVHEFKIRGVKGEWSRVEPTIEDHRYVSTQMIMKILFESGLDVHDFKQMIGWIIGAEEMPDFESGTDEQIGQNWRIYFGLQKIYHELGGME